MIYSNTHLRTRETLPLSTLGEFHLYLLPVSIGVEAKLAYVTEDLDILGQVASHPQQQQRPHPPTHHFSSTSNIQSNLILTINATHLFENASGYFFQRAKH